LYCLLSLFWSDYPDVGFKRWIKAVGDLVMVLIVVTDGHPTPALKRLITRAGFILLPVSILMIKYYANLGRAYDQWSGDVSNCGVAINKNMLGVVTFVLTLGALWIFLSTIRDKDYPDRNRHLVARGTLLAFGLWLLTMAHSATSGVCFTLGALLIAATSMDRFKKRPRAIHSFVLTILIVGGFTVIIGNQAVAHAVGRETNLTGRTDIWQTVIPMVPNPIVGAGFDSFWLGPRLERMWNLYPSLYLNEAHNGYIETYLNLGLIGVTLVVLLLLHGYRNVVNSFRNDGSFSASPLLLAYVFTAAFYSITEAGFREMDLIWVFFLLAVVASSQSSEVRATYGVKETHKLPTLRLQRPRAGSRKP
jgi:exopolysaccharide production protein ExoQ